MTNTANSGLQWEVAGGKKIKKIDTQFTKTNGKINTKELASKIPKIEALPPLKPDSTIYDVMRESDDDEEIKNSSKNKPKQQNKTASSNSNSASSSQANSPKQQQAQRTKPQESLNLVSASMASNTTSKKKAPSSPVPLKKLESELGTAITELKFDEFQKEYTNLSALFPNSLLLVIQNLSTALNTKLSHVPELELSQTHENESTFPSSKLDKKLEKFFNNLIIRLNKSDSELLYLYFLEMIFKESVKSTHGYKIMVQLLSKHSPSSLVSTLTEHIESINTNKHRHQKCLVALWILGQPGFLNLSDGIKIWFDAMLPFIGVKNFTNYIINYLNSILEFHKLDSKSSKKPSDSTPISLEQYLKLFELVNDKSINLQKETSNKLKTSFQIAKSLFIQDLKNKNSKIDLKYLFDNLQTDEKTVKQQEILELVFILFNQSKEFLNRWKNIYADYLPQSQILLEYLISKTNLKRIDGMREVLKHFDEQTTTRLASTQTTKTNPNRFHTNKKSSELDNLKRFNQLIKQQLEVNFKRISILSMVLRIVLITALTIGVFFYWDINYNKSSYTNLIQKELQRYGLLEQTLKLINAVKKFLINIQNLVYYYVPIWYKKINETVVPYTKKAYSFTVEYTTFVWVKSEPYRNQVVFYTNEGLTYIQQNYPILVKNLISVVQLTINYATTLINFFMHYVTIILDFIGIQLLGWKKGDLEKIFFDAFKLLLEYITFLFQWLNKILTQEN